MENVKLFRWKFGNFPDEYTIFVLVESLENARKIVADKHRQNSAFSQIQEAIKKDPLIEEAPTSFVVKIGPTHL